MNTNTTQPTPTWRSYGAVFLTLLLGVTISILLWQMVHDWEETFSQNEFQKRSASHVASLQKELDRYLEVIESIAALYTSRPQVERQAFHAFTQGMLERHPGIHALEWIPKVSDNKKALFERLARSDGFENFHITERQNQGKMIPAARRQVYYPVYFVEPYRGNEQALGFDLASNPTRLAALERARDTGEMVSTARITLVQESASQFGFLIFQPIYRNGATVDSLQSRRDNLQGYALGVFRIGDIAQAALNSLDVHQISAYLVDESAPANEQLLYTSENGVGATRSYANSWQGKISIPGRQWTLYLTPTPGFNSQFSMWQSWTVLSGGLLFTLLLAGYLTISRHRMAHIERLMLAQTQAEKKLRLAAKVLENTPEGVMVTDTDLTIISVNPAFTKTTGYREDEALGHTPRLLHSGRHDSNFYKIMWQSLKGSGRWQGEIWNRRKDGDIYPEWLNICAIHDAAGHTEHYAGIFSDLSSQEHIRKRLHDLAYNDALTGLPNRELFNDRLNNSLIQAQRSGKSMALLFLDLDRFKMINDTLGHSTGDELLIGVAKQLATCVRKSDTVARLGGDEFTLILNETNQPADAAQVAEKIIALFSQPIRLADKELFITASIGISHYPLDGNNSETLIKNADTAMYCAKEAGRNNYRFYKAEMSEHLKSNLALSNDLRQALEHNELQLVFQPQINPSDYQITGMEALLRWCHPEHGWVPPDRFIPIAEENGLIHTIGEWALQHACVQAKAWADSGFDHICMAVNLSGHQIKQADIVKRVADILTQTGLKPEQLELELTESVLMEDAESSMLALNKLKALGLQLAIDDFGTGYSSLSYLKRFPIDKLKIDKSFIDEITRDDDAAAITSTIITMGHHLHIKVIAEGVEEYEQFNLLKQQGCDEIQGYLFSQPVDAVEMTRLLEKGTINPLQHSGCNSALTGTPQ